tara:strand:- start:3209 stop:3814 length:606 start_codon:yes stop_codon:yes gene_type:complete
MGDTTNISDLPAEATFGTNNVVIQTSEKQSYSANMDMGNNADVPNTQIDEQRMMNEVVTGIQQASAGGATTLPSRDIPRNTESHMHDEQIKPNFVPVAQESNNDYIQNEETEDNLYKISHQVKQSKDSLEILYEEFQIPIIIALLYFILQLPIVRTRFLAILPSLHNSDGNPNLSGYIMNSLVFGILYYGISKILTHFGNV